MCVNGARGAGVIGSVVRTRRMDWHAACHRRSPTGVRPGIEIAIERHGGDAPLGVSTDAAAKS